MAADIVPDLYEKIHADFERKVNANKPIKTFWSRLQKKTADARGVSLYAEQLGRCAAYALTNNLTEENLPDGKLYWNIAERTIQPLLEECHQMVMAAASGLQSQEDEKEGINLKPIEPELPIYRVRDFMNKLVAVVEEDTDGTEV